MAHDDDLLDEVMRQLSGALGSFDAEALRDVVQEGLREALHALEPTPESEAEGPPPRRPDGRPHVVVLDGGLADEEPEPTEEEPASPVASTVSVQVVRSTDEGWLAPQGEWQTVFAGRYPTPYRLACTSGTLEVAVDDRTVATLRSGQSCDVEGTTVRARGEGSGSYRRLGTPHEVVG